MPFQIDGRGDMNAFVLTSPLAGVMLLTRRQPFYPSAAHDKFFSICTAFGGYTKFGIAPVCQAVEEEDRKGKVKIIAFDLNEPNMRLLQSDSLSIVLDQDAFQQGYQPPFLLYEYLMHHKMPDNALLYTDIAIRTKYNSDLVVFTDHSK